MLIRRWNHQHRSCPAANYLCGNAAHDRVSDGATTVGSHHNDIAGVLPGVAQYLLSRIAQTYHAVGLQALSRGFVSYMADELLLGLYAVGFDLRGDDLVVFLDLLSDVEIEVHGGTRFAGVHHADHVQLRAAALSQQYSGVGGLFRAGRTIGSNQNLLDHGSSLSIFDRTNPGDPISLQNDSISF